MAMIQEFSKGYTGKATSGKAGHELNQTGVAFKQPCAGTTLQQEEKQSTKKQTYKQTTNYIHGHILKIFKMWRLPQQWIDELVNYFRKKF